MSYRIGWQCFGSYEAATDYQMSQVVPQIAADGKLIFPVKTGSQWLFNGQVVKPSFGTCDIAQEMQSGAQIASALVGIMCIAFCFRVLVKFIQSMFDIDDEKAP